MQNINVGDVISGKVTGIEDYGIFISFDDGNSGLIHISEISNDFVKDVNDFAKIGDVLTVKVLSVENENHYKLSLKALNPSKKNKDDSFIKETDIGFLTLKNKLNEWVDEFKIK